MTKKVRVSAKKKDEVAELRQELDKAEEKEKRAVADYQNLVRRQREERQDLVKLATAGLVGDMLEPLEHLSLAAQQLKDPGLDMVVARFWQVLMDHGLEEINPQGQEFDLTTMEAVEASPDHGSDASDGQKNQVIQVRSKGYRLNGKLLKYAKVVVGPK